MSEWYDSSPPPKRGLNWGLLAVLALVVAFWAVVIVVVAPVGLPWYFPDVLRVVTAVALGFVVLVLPTAIDMRARPSRSMALVGGITCFAIANIGVILDHWGQPLAWHRTPLLLAGSILLTGYCLAGLKATRGRDE